MLVGSYNERYLITYKMTFKVSAMTQKFTLMNKIKETVYENFLTKINKWKQKPFSSSEMAL